MSETTERRWIVHTVPLVNGQVGYLGTWWPLSEEDLSLLRCGIAVNLALAGYSAARKAEAASLPTQSGRYESGTLL